MGKVGSSCRSNDLSIQMYGRLYVKGPRSSLLRLDS